MQDSDRLSQRVNQIELRLARLEERIHNISQAVNQIKDNEQKHVWALIMMLAGSLIPLVLKVLNII